MYLYGFLGDGMRTDSRHYTICTKEYMITSGCTNICRKGVEGEGTKVETRGSKGAPAGPTRGPLWVPFSVVPLDSSYFLLDVFSNKFLYWNK